MSRLFKTYKMKKIWLFSDTHGKHNELKVPEGIDIAICAGDMGTYKDADMCKPDLEKGLEWYDGLDIPHKIYCGGNHDTALEAKMINKDDYSTVDIVLHDEIFIDGINIFCSPYTPWFYNWAFQLSITEFDTRYRDAAYMWDKIPEYTDILVTHGPPKNILDECRDGYRAGCKELAKRIEKIKPKIHVFGHIHEDGGKMEKHGETTYYNASVLNLRYEHVNDGFVIEY